MSLEKDEISTLSLRCRRLADGATLPRPAHPGDAGLDLFALESCRILPGKWVRVRTGIAIELPRGTEAQVRPRSGLAFRHGVTVLNSPGTVDSGYRGEIMVILINFGEEPFAVAPGMRIAQLVVKHVLEIEIEEVPRLDDTVRGSGGFGSTGVHDADAPEKR